MHPYESSEGEDSNQNRTNGEEEGKRKTHDCSMRNHGPVPRLEVQAEIIRNRSGVAGPTRGGRGRRTPARSGTACAGLRDKRIQRVSTFGHGEIEVDVAHVVVFHEARQRLRVTFDGIPAFDGPYPLGVTRCQIH